MTFWYILSSFGPFSRFWYHVTRKIWQPCPLYTMWCRLAAWASEQGSLKWSDRVLPVDLRKTLILCIIISFRSNPFARSRHRNLRPRRRIPLCMQDDQIGRKIIRLAPADMARLPPSIIPTKIFFSSKQLCLSAGTTPTLNLPCFTREIVHFRLNTFLLVLT
jgi:hypothetical protein